jgi:hypothetical protein
VGTKGNSDLAVREVQVSPGLTMARPTVKVTADPGVRVDIKGNSDLVVLEVQVSPGLTMVRPTFKANPVPADPGVRVGTKGNSDLAVLEVQRLQAKGRPKFKGRQADPAVIAKVRASQRSVMTTQICRCAKSISSLAMAKLLSFIKALAERVGFEPTVRLPVQVCETVIKLISARAAKGRWSTLPRRRDGR